MRPDVIDLREFYATPLGQVARKLLRRRSRQLWPDVGGMHLLALGYPSPYLRQFQGEARRVLAFMPAQQGVHRWPVRDRNQVALVDEMELPLPDASIDRVLLGLLYAPRMSAGLGRAEALRIAAERISRIRGRN